MTSTGSVNGTATYGYDTAGDTTSRPGQTLTYNPAGQVASVTMGSATQQDVYDASGTLLLQTGSSGSTLFLGDTELHQAAGSSQASAVRSYSLAGMVFAERTTTAGVTGNGTLDWVGTDVDGTPDLEINSSTGTVTRRFMDPFGGTRGTPVVWSSDHGYLNKPDDAQTGLSQLGARTYDPSLGRFLTVDSVLAPGNPQQNNGYAYAGNDPVTNADPSGDCYEAASDSFSLNTNCVGGHGITAPAATPTPGSFTPHAAGNTTGSGSRSQLPGSQENDTSPWELGGQWLTGLGPRHQVFHAGDPFTKLLRKHGNIVNDVATARKLLANGSYSIGQPLQGRFDYSLGGWDGVGKYISDYSTLFDGGLTGNLAATYLGSYSVSITPTKITGPHSADVKFEVYNASTLASATHLPLYGIIPGYSNIENWENSLFPTGPLSETTQTITWTQEISWTQH